MRDVTRAIALLEPITSTVNRLIADNNMRQSEAEGLRGQLAEVRQILTDIDARSTSLDPTKKPSRKVAKKGAKKAK